MSPMKTSEAASLLHEKVKIDFSNPVTSTIYRKCSRAIITHMGYVLF